MIPAMPPNASAYVAAASPSPALSAVNAARALLTSSASCPGLYRSWPMNALMALMAPWSVSAPMSACSAALLSR